MGYTILTTIPTEKQAPWNNNLRTRMRPIVVARHGTTDWMTGQENLVNDPGYLGPDKLTLDHVIPRSMGGASTADNLHPASLESNINRGNTNDILVERHIGFKETPKGRVPCNKMRLVNHKGQQYNVPRMTTSRLAEGAAVGAGFAIVWDLATQAAFQAEEHGFDLGSYEINLVQTGKETLIGGVSGLASMAFTTAMGIWLPGTSGLIVVGANTLLSIATRQGVRSAINRNIDTKAIKKDAAQALAVSAATLALSMATPIPPAWVGAGIGLATTGFAIHKRSKIRKRQNKWRSINVIIPRTA